MAVRLFLLALWVIVAYLSVCKIRNAGFFDKLAKFISGDVQKENKKTNAKKGSK